MPAIEHFVERGGNIAVVEIEILMMELMEPVSGLQFQFADFHIVISAMRKCRIEPLEQACEYDNDWMHGKPPPKYKW